MEYEAFEDKNVPGNWRVEAIDFESGDVFVTMFAGPDAEDRAREYASWKQATPALQRAS